MKIPACAVLPGAGTRLGAVAGAMKVLSTVFDFVAFAGTSGGGLVALFLAAGKTIEQLHTLCLKVLTRDDLLDSGSALDIFNPNNTTEPHLCLFHGQKIRELLKEVFGDMRMRDLAFPCRVGATSLWTEKVGLIDSARHGDVLVRDAAYATMAIEGFFDPARIRPDNARTYGDGGAGLNVAAGAWDDRMERTLVIRFTEQQTVHTLDALLRAMDGDADYLVAKPVRTIPENVSASFGVMMGAASSSFPSKKTNVYEVVLTSDADGLKFGISAAENERRWQHGVDSATKQLPALT